MYTVSQHSKITLTLGGKTTAIAKLQLVTVQHVSSKCFHFPFVRYCSRSRKCLCGAENASAIHTQYVSVKHLSVLPGSQSTCAHRQVSADYPQCTEVCIHVSQPIVQCCGRVSVSKMFHCAQCLHICESFCGSDFCPRVLLAAISVSELAYITDSDSSNYSGLYWHTDWKPEPGGVATLIISVMAEDGNCDYTSADRKNPN